MLVRSDPRSLVPQRSSSSSLEPLKIATTVLGKFEQKLLLVTAVGYVPDVAG